MSIIHFQNNQELFKTYGIKNTKQRNTLLDILKASETSLTAEQIFLKMKKVEEAISLSTIYRILELFVSLEIAVKSYITEDNKSTYELRDMEHKHHLFCVSCKKTIPIKDCPFHTIEKTVENETGYQITGHKLEIYGYCEKCKKDSKCK